MDAAGMPLLTLQGQLSGGAESSSSFNSSTGGPNASWKERVFPLIKSNDWEEALHCIETEANTFVDVTIQDSSDPFNNVLQCACNIEDEEKAEEVVTWLLEFAKRYHHGYIDMYNFVNASNNQSPTALDVAISNGYKRVVKKLLFHAADVNLRPAKKSKDALYRIYDRVHKVMVSLLDDAFKIEKDKLDSSNETYWSLKCDFTPIIGVAGPNDDQKTFKLRQTNNLSTALRHRKRKRSDILLHPLVQIFLHEKANRYRWFIRLSVLYHILWSLVCVLFIVHNTQLIKINTSAFPMNDNCKHFENPFLFPEDNHFNAFVYSITGIFLMISLAKEIIEVYTCPGRFYYWRQYENTGQWILMFVVVLAMILPLSINEETNMTWLRTLASILYIIGIVLALLLIQGQFTKLYSLGIYNQMFIKCFKRFVYFMAAFFPTLLAFMFTFFVLLSQNDVFELEYGLLITKIIAMLTGELNYDDIFYPEEPYCLPYPTATKFVFLVFVVLVVILLPILLIGLTVQDVKELKEECITNNLAARLEVIYLLEHFLTSGPVLRGLKFFKLDSKLQKLSVISTATYGTDEPDAENGSNNVVQDIKMCHLPTDLQKAVMNYSSIA